MSNGLLNIGDSVIVCNENGQAILVVKDICIDPRDNLQPLQISLVHPHTGKDLDVWVDFNNISIDTTNPEDIYITVSNDINI